MQIVLGVDDLSQDTLLEETDSPLSSSTVANSSFLGMGFCTRLLATSWDLIVSEFICVIAQLCLEDAVFLAASTTSSRSFRNEL